MSQPENQNQPITELMTKPAILESYNMMEKVKLAAPKWEEETGINPLNLYCSRTGRIVGYTHESILHTSLATIESKDLEEIMDELTIRCILSMRPASDLMYLNKDSMKALIDHNPKAACIFLLTKAFESKELMYKKISPLHKSSKIKHQYDSSCIDSKIEWNRGLVELSHAMSDENVTGKHLKRFALMLLEIDAKVGLHKIKPPSESWGFSLISHQNEFKDFMKLIRYYHKQLEKIEKAQSNWYNNVNALSLDTFFAMNQTRPKKLSVKARDKERKVNNMKADLIAILKDATSIDDIIASTKDIAKRAEVNMKPTGLKLNFKLKGKTNET